METKKTWGDAPQPPKNLPTGEGEVPLAPPVSGPPAPKVEVRTMGSDLRSTQEQGGGAPRPYIPKSTPPPSPPPPAPRTPSVRPPPPPPPAPKPAGGAAAFGGSKTPFSKPQAPFTPPRVGSPVPPTAPRIPQKPPVGGPPARAGLPGKPGAPAPAVLTGAPKPKKKHGFLLGVISFVVVIGLAAVGYFFIYPMFTAAPAAPEVATPPPMPEPTPPLEIPPIAEPIPPEPEPTPPAEIIPGIDAHTSLFTIPADITADVTVTPMDVAGLRAALPPSSASVPLFREVVIKTGEGKVVAFGEFAKRLVPGFFTPELAASFADDATYFTYSASDGMWFGLAVSLKSDVNLGELQGKMSVLQHDPDNSNFFLADPGAQGVWRDGTIKERPASLVDFATPGATLGYAWFDRTFLIITNATAGEEVARRLGF